MSRFNPDTSDYITKAVFDDALSTSEIRILIVLFSSSRGYLFSSRKIGEFIGKSHTTTYRAIKKLLQLEYLIDTNGNYSLNTGRIGCFKNETGVSNMKQEGVSNMKRKCFKNETTIYINNKRKENKNSATAETLPLPNPDLIYMKVCDDPEEPRSEHICMTQSQAIKLRDEICNLDLWPDLTPIQALYDLFLAMDVWVSGDIKKRKRENYYRTALNWIKREAQKRDQRNANRKTYT